MRCATIGSAISTFCAKCFSDFLQIELSGNGRDGNSEVFHIPVYRNQQRFVDLIGIQPQFAHHLVTKVCLVWIVIVGVNVEGNVVFSSNLTAGVIAILLTTDN